ncbi:DnaJ protein [Ktedonobacter racemifer DSM 44963]|uniref:DnaJ protein n=1 Tax=Ktedonobacter racemifer DSM 44963 TaxID=485913 RepID=D6U3Y2_KTERA|nr:DnaJ protein [Ktedonobacter racemifer DSM 44963]
MKTCISCRGSGSLTCYTCRGYGQDKVGDKCPSCDGNGTVERSYCDGSGMVDDEDEDDD